MPSGKGRLAPPKLRDWDGRTCDRRLAHDSVDNQ